MKTALLFALSITLSASANADSWCRFETNLIGTKAIGFALPYELMQNAINDKTNTCLAHVRDHPAKDTPFQQIPCTDFVATNSYTREQLKEYIENLWSLYFAFLIYDYTPGWVALKLKTGETKWARAEMNGPPFHSYGGIMTPQTAPRLKGQLSNQPGVFTPKTVAIYSAPDLASQIPKPDIHAAKHRPFLLSTLDKMGLFSDKLDTLLQHRYVTGHVAFIYAVENLVTTTDGAQWFKATEHLVLQGSYMNSGDLPKLFPEDRTLPKRLEPDETISPALRTIYVPFKDSDGTIKTMITLGPGCD